MPPRTSSRRTAGPAFYTPTTRASKEYEKIDAIFYRYADKNDRESIGPEGIETLCGDLGYEPSHFNILLFAWKLQAAKQGYFTLEEWRKGLRLLRVDSLDKLKKAVSALQLEVQNDPDQFKEVYRFAFQYCLTEPRQKTLDVESACLLLKLIFDQDSQAERFSNFLQEQKEYRAINLDQWTAFLRLCEEVKPDLSDYDESQAWPLLLDNYVEWTRKMSISKEDRIRKT